MTTQKDQLDEQLMQDPELTAAFIAEAREHLDSVGDDFLLLEQQLENPDKELINKIFRAIHSVKGAAGFLGFSKVSELAHTMETLLTRIRSDQLIPIPAHIDALLAGVDQLTVMLRDVDLCREADISTNLAQINQLLDVKTAIEEIPSQKKKKLPKQAVPDRITLDMGNTIRLHVDILDKLMLQAGELVLIRNQQMLGGVESEGGTRSLTHRLNVAVNDLQQTVIQARMQPIDKVVGKFPRVVRDLSRQLGKNIRISISGGQTELDRTILEIIADPLTHIIRNCCDHGIEPPEERKQAGKPVTGHISIATKHEAGLIVMEISDDGRGIDLDIVRRKALERKLKTREELKQMSDKATLLLIFLPGFSTIEEAGDLSGRGVGMDVVKIGIEQLGGSIDLDSEKGKGLKILLRLPLTLAIIPCLIVTTGEELFAIPQANLQELFCIYDQDVRDRIERADDQEVFRLRNQLLPLVRLSEVLRQPERFKRKDRARIAEQYRQEQDKLYFSERVIEDSDHKQSLNCVVLKIGTSHYGLVVDEIRGTEEIVVKPLHRSLQSLGIYSGVTIMGNGRSAMILDGEGTARHAGVNADVSLHPDMETVIDEGFGNVLLFQSGGQEQLAVPLPRLQRIENIKMEDIEFIGEREFITVQGISTRVFRLEEVLDVSPLIEGEEMFLLIVRNSAHPAGLFCSSLVDIAEISTELDQDSLPMNGLLGTCILDKVMSLVLDIPALLRLFEPEWFAGKRSEAQTPGKQKNQGTEEK